MKGPKLWLLLAASAIAVGFQNYVFFSKLDPVPTGIHSEPEEAFEDESGEDRESLAPVAASDMANWVASLPTPGRNPFFTATEAEGRGTTMATQHPRVTGTLWSSDRRVAWIDGQPHSEGDWVGAHRVERIEPTRVVLRQGESQLELRTAPQIRIEDEESTHDR